MIENRLSKERLKCITDLIDNNEEFSNWLDFIKSNESDYYKFMQEYVGRTIHKVNNMLSLNVKEADMIASIILTALSTCFIVDYNRKKDIVDKLLDNNKENKFQQWLDGKLGDVFYNYSIIGLKKSSSTYIAKTNHNKLVKRWKLKNKTKDSMEKFEKIEYEITNNSKSLIKKSEIIL